MDWDWDSLFSFPETVLPPTAFIPLPEAAGALSVPGLEPLHPIVDCELTADAAWSEILCTVDLSCTDVEDLAARLTAKIRCYGFGPVLLRKDVALACKCRC